MTKDHTRAAAADTEWRDQVVEFVAALRDRSVDADADVFHTHERGIDWTRWGPNAVAQVDVVLAVVNAAWREAWTDDGDGTRGRGAVAEIDVLRSMFNDDRAKFQRTLVLVNLPGTDVKRPLGLDRVPRVRVPTFDDAGMSDLMRILTEQPEFQLPPLGARPILPPRPLTAQRPPPGPVASAATETDESAERGSGDAVIDAPVADVCPGVLVVVRGNEAGRHFAVKPADGARSLVNTTEAYRGTTYLPLPVPTSSVRLQVKATGPWSVHVTSVEAASAVMNGETASRAGDAVLAYEGPGGVANINGNHGSRHFAVRVIPPTGGSGQSLLNTVEPYDGSVMCPPGPILLAVTAVGAWSLTIS